MEIKLTKAECIIQDKIWMTADPLSSEAGAAWSHFLDIATNGDVNQAVEEGIMPSSMRRKEGVLVGNVFPTSLMRARCQVVPSTLDELRNAVAGKNIVSFWGHANTLGVAQDFTGLDLTPKTERPAIMLNKVNHPSLGGENFDGCWVVSPDYRPGFRPAIGTEVTASEISSWQILHIIWED